MKKKTVVLIVAASLVVLGMIVSVVGLAAMGFDFSKLGTGKSVTNTYEVDEAFENISIDNTQCDITLLPSTDGKFKAVCTSLENITHEVKVENNTLMIKEIDDRHWYEYVGINLTNNEIILYLPETQYKRLTVNGNTSDIEISNKFSFESIDAIVTTGDITVKASVSDTLSLESTTGEISVSGTNPKKMTLESETGKVKVGSCTVDSLTVSTGTGDISLNSVNASGAIALTASTGEMNVTNSKCKTLNVEVDTGDFEAENLLAEDDIIIYTTTGEVELLSCDGGLIKIKTDTGDVYCSFLTDKIVFAQSDTGDIKVPSSSEGGKCNITTDTGDIEVVIKQKS